MTAAGDDLPVSRRTVRRWFLLSALPLAGMALFAAGGVLGLVTFGHNHSLGCDSPAVGFGSASSCSHHSYALAIALGVAGLVIVMVGGLVASFYSVDRIGLPVLGAVVRGVGRRPPQEPPAAG